MHKQPEVTAATRRKIMDAFWMQYKATPIEKITISTITKNAGVHRSTFYEYFNDIYDLLEQFENDFLEHLKLEYLPIAKRNFSQIKNDHSSPALGLLINTTLSFFSVHGELLYHLSGSSGDPAFRKKLYNLFKSSFMAIHSIPEDSPYADYLSSFVFAVILNNLEYWFENRDTITMEEVIMLTYKIMGDSLTNPLFYNTLMEDTHV